MMNELREILNNNYQHLMAGNEQHDDRKNNSTALVSHGTKKFKGLCYKCGKVGHIGC